jgi:hypothetical protein
MVLLIPLVAYQELPGKRLGDDPRTLRSGVDEVGGDHAGMAVVPALHGAVAPHRGVSIEESAAQHGGYALLDRDELGIAGMVEIESPSRVPRSIGLMMRMEAAGSAVRTRAMARRSSGS